MPEPTECPCAEQKTEERTFPVPPEEFCEVFAPIIDGVLAGWRARQKLVTLTAYCMELEMALETQDVRMVKLGQSEPEEEEPARA